MKYEELYLRAYDSVGDARVLLGRYQRPHSSLGRKTPDEAYYTPATIAMAA